MDLLVVTDERTPVGRRLLAQIRSIIPEGRFQVCRSLKELCRWLWMPHHRLKAILLVAETRARLNQLCSLGVLLRHPKLILVLPERSRETIAAGFSLQPCLSSYVDSAFHEVVQVLNHILQPASSPQD